MASDQRKTRGRVFSAAAAEAAHRRRVASAHAARKAVVEQKREQEDRAAHVPMRRSPLQREAVRRSASAPSRPLPAVQRMPVSPPVSPVRVAVVDESVDALLAAALSERAAAAEHRHRLQQEFGGGSGTPASSRPRSRRTSQSGRADATALHRLVEQAVVDGRESREELSRLRSECDALRLTVVQLKRNKAGLEDEIRSLRGRVSVSAPAAGDRDYTAALRKEIEFLAKENSVLRRKASQAGPLAAALRRVSIENSLAVEQMARLRLALEAGRTSRTEQQRQPYGSGMSPPRSTHTSPGPPPWASSPEPAESTLPPPQRQHRTRKRAAPRPAEEEYEPDEGADRALARLQRALAPAPSVSDMAHRVDTMVSQLHAKFAAVGEHLPLERKGDCVYKLGRKSLRLAVHAGQLVVRSGCGYENFVTYLSRAINRREAIASPG
eukprot:TRINITY_DN10342_c0_g1_i1.p1 TRINITY_DN10342_c0_g1~~TRINITY_DN10342_c0_g1_i1.p1  ORF type:complete len:439 (+),score=71.46 TRINITY_DN10342_c0_g1_i1:84-1400(+)